MDSKTSQEHGNNIQFDDEKEEKSAKPPSVLKLLKLGKPEWGVLFLAFVFMITAEIVSLCNPLILAKAYDKVVEPSTSNSIKISEVNKVMLTVLILHVSGNMATFAGSSIMAVAGERVVSRLRNTLYRSILSQEISFFDETKTGELVSRLGSDTTLLQSATSRAVSSFSVAIIRIISCISLMFWISPKLATLTIGMTMLIFFACIPFGKQLGRLSKRYQDILGKAQTRSTEALGLMRTVQSFAAEDREVARYKDTVGDPDSFKYWIPDKQDTIYRTGFYKNIVASGFFCFIFGAGFASLYAGLWFGFKLVLDGEITIGDLTAFNAYIIQIGFGLAEGSNNLAQILEARGASTRVFQLLERVPAIPTPIEPEEKMCTSTKKSKTDIENGFDSKKLIKPESMEGAISFENISFAYPSRKDLPVLRNFTLTILPNTTTAIVGSSGAGKSTVVSLLQRFYDVDSGRVIIDGHDVRTLDLKWMRKHIGYVQQEPQLFGLTVRENVCFGLEKEITDSEVEKACKEANAHDFIVKLPQAYDTLVGERGVKLSGGQKQRIAIARALVVNPRILLLDEATSALDSESEHLVQDAINRAVMGKTVLIIAHRLSTIKKSQQIVMLDNHEIIDRGIHEDLIERCEKYKDLIKRQTTEQGRKDE